MLGVRHAGQCRHRLALRAGDHEDLLLRGQRGDVAGVHEDAAWDLEVAALGGDPHVAHHGAPHERHASAVQGGGVEDLLDPVDVAGEGGHDDLSLGVGEDVVQDLADLALVADHAGNLGVGGVYAEQVHPFLTEAREGAQVGDAPVDGQGVHLEVSGDEHVAGVGADHDRHGVGDGVVDGHELQVEGAIGDLLVLDDLTQHRVHAVLLELGLHEGQGELAAHQGDVLTQAQQVGHASDMVLVPVSQHQGDDVVDTVLEGGEVGEDEVDAGLVLLGEEHAAVDDEQFSVELEDGHVAADLSQASQRGDAHRAVGEGAGGLQRRKVRHAGILPRMPRLSIDLVCSGWMPLDPVVPRLTPQTGPRSARVEKRSPPTQGARAIHRCRGPLPGTPSRIRTGAAAVRGRCPRPLNDGGYRSADIKQIRWGTRTRT